MSLKVNKKRNHVFRAVKHLGRLRVLAIIPGSASNPVDMIFAKRQVEALEALGVQVRRFFLASRINPICIIQAWWRLRREISLFAPDVIHCHYGTMTAFIAVCSTTRPVVITFRGSDLNPVPSGNKLRVLFGHLLSQLSAIRAAGIICVSQELGLRLLVGMRNVDVIPTGVDIGSFKPALKSTARSRLGFGGTDSVVLFNAGNSTKVKRLDLAEKAVAEARKYLPTIKLVVLRGDIPPEEIPVYHNAADVLLVTSDFEGSPTIVQEAVACGLPVVSVAVGDVPEILRSVNPSKIVPRDAVLIGAALLEIISLKQRSNGPEIALKELSSSVVGARVLQVLHNAAMR